MGLRASWRSVAVISYVGLRGIVSLAVAMALPLTRPDGSPFPERNLIVFLTFAVIVTTLVVQGLSLPFLLRLLGFDFGCSCFPIRSPFRSDGYSLAFFDICKSARFSRAARPE